jgi:flagellar biosynthetic protein FliQ
MGAEQIVALGRHAMETAIWIAAPVLLTAIVVSVLISIMQVMTSVQDMTISTVPRLAAVGGTIFLMMHWMLRRLVGFTVHLFSDFHSYIR